MFIRLNNLAEVCGGKDRLWPVEGDVLPLIHDENPLAVGHGVQSMGNGQHRSLAEGLADQLLNELLRLSVDVGRRFVDEQDAAGTENGARHADQLALPGAEIGPALLDAVLEVQSFELHGAEGPETFFVGRLTEGIEIEAERAGEEHRTLGNDAQPRAKHGERHATDLDAVEENLAADRRALNETKESLEERGFTRPGPTDDADLLSRGDAKLDLLQHRLQLRPIAHRVATELDRPFTRPVRSRFDEPRIFFFVFLRGQFAVLSDSLRTGHVVLGLGRLAHGPLEEHRQVDRVHQTEGCGGGLDAVAKGDGQERSEQGEQRGHQVQSQAEPANCADENEERTRVVVDAFEERTKEVLFHAEGTNGRQTSVQRRGEQGVDGTSADALQAFDLPTGAKVESTKPPEGRKQRNENEKNPRIDQTDDHQGAEGQRKALQGVEQSERKEFVDHLLIFTHSVQDPASGMTLEETQRAEQQSVNHSTMKRMRTGEKQVEVVLSAKQRDEQSAEGQTEIDEDLLGRTLSSEGLRRPETQPTVGDVEQTFANHQQHQEEKKTEPTQRGRSEQSGPHRPTDRAQRRAFTDHDGFRIDGRGREIDEQRLRLFFFFVFVGSRDRLGRKMSIGIEMSVLEKENLIGGFGEEMRLMGD